MCVPDGTDVVGVGASIRLGGAGRPQRSVANGGLMVQANEFDNGEFSLAHDRLFAGDENPPLSRSGQLIQIYERKRPYRI